MPPGCRTRLAKRMLLGRRRRQIRKLLPETNNTTLGTFKLEPGGAPLVSRYRFYVHDGALDPKAANRLWADLAQPPELHIVKP